MSVQLKAVMDAATALPVAFEAKFPKAPKISTQLLKFDTMIPKGPTIWPAPPVGGFPTFNISKLPDPPKIFGSPVTPRGMIPPVRLPPVSTNIPPAPNPQVISGLNVDIPANTAKQVGYVYTGTGM